MSLADALERAAEAQPDLADVIRPANGDPERLIAELDAGQAAGLLAWLLAEAPDDAEELAREWVGHEAGLAALSTVDEGSLPKPGRKALCRMHHRLRSQGAALPVAPTAPRVATLPELESGVEGAFVSPLDPSGSRAVVIVQTNPSGGARIFELITDELLGIRRCDVYKATQGKARRFLRDATEPGAGAGVPVSVAAAGLLVERAAAAQPADRSVPRTFAEWRSQIASSPEATQTPGEDAAAKLPEPTDEDRKRLLEMIADGTIGPWPPREESLREAAEQLGEARDAKIVVAGGRTQERFEEILEEAAESAYDEAFSGHMAARFEESAYVFMETEREPEARACLAGAQAFRTGEARSNPVARALLGRLLAPLMKEKEQEESESPLVKP